MNGEDFVRSLFHLNYAYGQAIGEIMNGYVRSCRSIYNGERIDPR